MDVFHYVANELKDTSLFENSPDEQAIDEGAVYNDFDSTPLALLETNDDERFQFSQVSNHLTEGLDVDIDSVDLENAVEEAIIATDGHDGFLYEYLVKTFEN